jgi:hypothetical protein
VILRLQENIHAPYYALAIVGTAANLVDIALSSRKPVPSVPKPALAS